MTKVNVKIPKHLIDQIQAQVDQSQGEFNTPEEYIEYVLTEDTRGRGSHKEPPPSPRIHRINPTTFKETR